MKPSSTFRMLNFFMLVRREGGSSLAGTTQGLPGDVRHVTRRPPTHSPQRPGLQQRPAAPFPPLGPHVGLLLAESFAQSSAGRERATETAAATAAAHCALPDARLLEATRHSVTAQINVTETRAGPFNCRELLSEPNLQLPV